MRRRFCGICLLTAAAAVAAAVIFAPKKTPEPIDVSVSPEPTRSIYISPTIRLLTGGAVVEMSLEEYVAGVVAAEMPASFNIEALKAQAVAARTYAVRRMADPCGDGWDVCSSSLCCQAYDTDAEMRENWGAAYEAYRAKVRLAAEETAGLILTWNGEPIEALYHSTSGGYTENSEHVFSAALPYLVGVESPGEEDAPRYETTAVFSRRDLAKALNAAFPGAELDRNRLESQLEVLTRYASGRVETVRVGGVTVSGRDFRKALSLNSAAFSFEFSSDSVTITVRGFGHGVGMSQLGANAMAAGGASFEEILLHYYTGVTLELPG